MSRREPTVDRSEVDATLQAVDAALWSGEATLADPTAREVQEIALALRSDAPTADREFAQRLDRRVAEGFPADTDDSRASATRLRNLRARISTIGGGLRGARLRGLVGRRPSIAALGGLASVLVALAVAISLQAGTKPDDKGTSTIGREPSPTQASERQGGTTERQGGTTERSPSSEKAADGAPSASLVGPTADESRSIAPSILPPEPPGGGAIAPGERNRRIERSASLTLAAAAGRLDAVADEIIAIVDRRRGFVLQSSLQTGEGSTTGGSFDLRVPATALAATLRDLSRLGDVRERTQSGTDVTSSFVSAEDRLDVARAQRRGLLRRLANAESEAQSRALRERLNLVSAEIRGLADELRALRERTTYSAVTVTLIDKRLKPFPETSQKDGTAAAFDDALDSLTGSFNLVVRILGVAIPLGIVAGLAWLAASAIRRRRRENTLS